MYRTIWLGSRISAALVTILISSISETYAETSVVTTIKPVHSLVVQVMGSTGTPELLLTGAESPHTYIMKPSDASKLGSATLVFRMSASIEPFTVKVAKSLAKSTELVTLQLSPGVVSLAQRTGGPFEAHEHDHDHDDANQGADNSGVDGHVWLDPANAKAMLDEIARKLSVHAPQFAATYQSNAAAAKARIDALSSDLARQLQPVSNRPYIVFHDAYQYFEKHFGLNAVGSITLSPDIPLSGKRLSRIRERVTSAGAVCVFGEPFFEAKVINAVTEGTPAKTGLLDPEGASLPAGPDLYETLMRNLASNLLKCLAHSK